MLNSISITMHVLTSCSKMFFFMKVRFESLNLYYFVLINVSYPRYLSIEGLVITLQVNFPNFSFTCIVAITLHITSHQAVKLISYLYFLIFFYTLGSFENMDSFSFNTFGIK